ncbi:MAG TPA: UV DNA damage repair endonuclease UvsE [Symbiobacteriaceae bacterium]|nr:UV DNA damage repair endonuclease UvsE [Symbiobacteriaceae bacterium]
MAIRLGYACINLSLQVDKKSPRFKALTAKRLSTMEPQERRAHLYQVGKNNLETVAAILQWNATQGIRFYRITSELIPLATHPVAEGWDWADDLASEFARVARLAEKTGSRLTTHPGQYTVLNAKEARVIESSIRDLVYHERMLTLLGAQADWGMVLHVGGGYGDKEAAASRYRANFAHLPAEVQRRLWIENDDTTWDTAEALAVAESVGRPLIFDIHHHRVLREDDWLPWFEAAMATWGAVRPKMHYSTPKDGVRSRAHADGIDPDDFAQFLARIGERELDVMLECKAKDLALLQLRTDLAERGFCL